MNRPTLFVLLALIASGCAMGQKIEYRADLDLRLTFPVKAPLRVGVLDRRAAQTDTWVGKSKSTVGVPYPVYTESGRPLSQDLGETWTKALTRGGLTVQQLVIPTGSGEAAARQLVAPTADDAIGVLVILNEWETSTLAKMELNYYVQIEVLGPQNTVLAKGGLSADDLLIETDEPVTGDRSRSDIRQSALLDTARSVLRQLLTTPQIRTALAAAQ